MPTYRFLASVLLLLAAVTPANAMPPPVWSPVESERVHDGELCLQRKGRPGMCLTCPRGWSWMSAGPAHFACRPPAPGPGLGFSVWQPPTERFTRRALTRYLKAHYTDGVKLMATMRNIGTLDSSTSTATVATTQR